MRHESPPKIDAQERALLMRTLQLVHRETFSTYTTLQRDLYLSPLTHPQITKASIPSTVTSAIWDLTPSNTTIVIILIILSLDLSVLIAVFWLRHKHYAGPPIPRSIGSLVPWVVQSSMLNDTRGTGNWSEEQRKEHLEQLGYRDRFGEWRSGDRRVVLDYDERPMIEEDEYEMDEYELPRSIEREEAETDPRDGRRVRG